MPLLFFEETEYVNLIVEIIVLKYFENTQKTKSENDCRHETGRMFKINKFLIICPWQPVSVIVGCQNLKCQKSIVCKLMFYNMFCHK